MTAPTPDHIMQTATGYGLSRALLTAVGLGLHSRLAKGAMTLDKVVGEFGLQHRPAMDFLDLLVSVDLLGRDGDGEGALYRNTEATALYLDREQPTYIGGILELWDKRNYRFWADFTEALQTGKPQNETKHAETSFFETLYADPERLEAFMKAMNGSSIRNFQLLAKSFPFDAYKSLVDIGGADALLSRCVAAEHAHLSCTSFDLPVVTDIARRRIAEAGLEDRIEAVSGDFFSGPLPQADIITMGMILHDWNLDRKKLLVKNAYEALPDGGAFIAIEALIDDARRENTFGLFLSLNMLIEFGDAFDYTGAEFIDWCREAGFRKFEIIPLAGPSSAAVAYK
ncbi:MAG: methyltransferase [Roseibium sp.]|uniref:methyltransferase n=1 Tax=Roseibium sp. TaxID=1936156 RepID=UPI002603159B|nr:methyltransferase [Roseibium sp.]MCV0424728.1 methyltransferase [Roseibium sp.]